MSENPRELYVTSAGETPEKNSSLDWEAMAQRQAESETAQTVVNEPTAEPNVTYRRARSPWDFTDGQRIVIGILIWLNIIVGVLLYLTLTGQLPL